MSELWIPERGEVIWIDFNPQVGSEMRDIHPMLVLTSKLFNERTGIVNGLPMTTSERNETNPFAIKVTSKKEVSYVLTHQIKSFDWRKRGAKPHPMKKLTAADFNEALLLLNDILVLTGRAAPR